MSRTLKISLAALLVISGLQGCGRSDTTGPDSELPPTDLDLSPRADEEAEWAAVWLSGALAAPDSLYNQIRTDLEMIRTQFRNQYPILDSLRFQPRWFPDLQVDFETSARNEIREGTYRDWDSLNEAFGVSGIDSTGIIPGGTYLKLTFEKRLHPARLMEFYLTLRGVRSVGYRTLIGTFANVYPWRADGSRTYLFRECEGPCVLSQYWYSRVDAEGPELVGYYDSWGEPPGWWEEARVGMRAFGHGR